MARVVLVFVIFGMALVLISCTGASEEARQEQNQVTAPVPESFIPPAIKDPCEKTVRVKAGEVICDFMYVNSTPDGLDGFEASFFEVEHEPVVYKELQGVTLADYRGKVVFLNFWGIWCPPCLAEMPAMERMYQDYKDRDFVVVAVEIDQNLGIDKIREFIEENKITYPILLAPKKYQWSYGINAWPTTFIIGPDGTIEEVLHSFDWDSVAGRGKIEIHLKEEIEVPAGIRS